MTQTSKKPMRHLPTVTPMRSHTSLTRSGRRGSSVGISILAALILGGCAEGMPAPISSDRTIVKLEDGGYRVTETFLQERYQLERALRLRLERCEVELNHWRVPTSNLEPGASNGPEKRQLIPWPLLVPFRQPALDHLVHP